ncbi:hypothetical protein BXY41_104124 [Lacrimispora xylanisolvens]|uniref:Lipocalin-like protein n=1 Tax=Lacrimispora xylanisolvens TaxID=384636 RepID=A0A2S6HU01_9FIRM|nr:hypothetical protein [Hungatella xylanolytica]MBE5989698.1 hypothetical protein [Paenibacillaceae bacterium]PPK81323.1 hypothetical protein BXY41_104124 [Hungatella xylanolytica]
MKKRLSILLAILMVLGAMLVGCGAKNDSVYVGTTWTLNSVEAEGIVLEGELLASAMDAATIKFDAKKVTLNFGTENGEGTWSEKDNVITIKSDGETIECPITDSKLLFELEGTKMYFVKDEKAEK